MKSPGPVMLPCARVQLMMTTNEEEEEMALLFKVIAKSGQ